MKNRLLLWGSCVAVLFLMFSVQISAEDSGITEHKKLSIDIGPSREEKEVGLKRMEIIDKALSPELVQKKRALIQSVEKDYTRKIEQLLQPLTSSIGKNIVITHVDIDFLDPDFQSQIHSSQRVSVSIIMGRAGFENWAMQDKTEQETLDQLKGMIQGTFKIPKENVSIMVAP
ncbi:MAG: hypothetical protein C4522_16930 [Desulfobacteraceae bacterium]|nr:MAG: hypothetical protein C4522_16930 [Desulfobacteraceae bacterium]